MKRYRTKDLAAMTTDRLEDLLRSEIARRPLNDDRIRKIMAVLEERKPARPVELTEDESADWENFVQLCTTEQPCAETKGCVAGRKRGFLISAIAACLCLVIFALPPALGANNVIDLIGQISSGKIKLFHPGNAYDDYVFQTDNPDLQKLYDTVVEMGITEPVVPMWLPEGYVLKEKKVVQTPTKHKVYASFYYGENFFVLKIEAKGYSDPYTVESDMAEFEPIELYGSSYYFTSNDGATTVLWGNEGYLCSISTNADEDICYDILRSIQGKVVE